MEGLREGLTIVLASMAAFAAGAAGLSLIRSDSGWESTAVVRAASPDGPLRSSVTARRALVAAGAAREAPGELLGNLTAERRSGGEAAFTVYADRPGAARRLAGSYARVWAGASSAPVRVEAAERARRGRGTGEAALIGAVAGLLAGLLLAFLRELLDVRRTSSRSVASRLDLRALGRVPEAPDGVEEAYRLPALESPNGPAAWAYTRLAARVAAAAEEESARVVAVCGSVAEDRGEQVAAALAAALAAEGLTVAVAELDPARPTLRRQFALPRGPGAAEVARGEAELDDALVPVPGVSGLSVLVAGAGPLPEAGAGEAVVESLRERFDLVVVAAPALLANRADPPFGADALVLAVALRGTRRSRRPRLERVLEALDVPVLGFVLLASAGEAGPGPPAALSAARA